MTHKDAVLIYNNSTWWGRQLSPFGSAATALGVPTSLNVLTATDFIPLSFVFSKKPQKEGLKEGVNNQHKLVAHFLRQLANYIEAPDEQREALERIKKKLRESKGG